MSETRSRQNGRRRGRGRGAGGRGGSNSRGRGRGEGGGRNPRNEVGGGDSNSRSKNRVQGQNRGGRGDSSTSGRNSSSTHVQNRPQNINNENKNRNQASSAPKRKYITFFNLLDEPYSPLACPEGREFQRALIRDNSIKVFRGESLASEGPCACELPLNAASFRRVFGDSAQVVVPDSMFMRESILLATEDYFDRGGPEALAEYFREGGTVLVHCLEGIYHIGALLSEQFGCRWELRSIESSDVVFTERGRQLLSGAALSAFSGQKIHFMRSPKGEGLVSKKLLTREEFEADYYDPDPDDVDGLEKYYRQYLERETGQHAVCVYEGFGCEGKLVWNGDRTQSESFRYLERENLTFYGEPSKNKAFKWTFEQILSL